MALAQRESNFRAKASSKYGYKGMMQCTSCFAKAYGYKARDLYQADVSIEIAARYLRSMKNKHETYSKAIACYVCGSGSSCQGDTLSRAGQVSYENTKQDPDLPGR